VPDYREHTRADVHGTAQYWGYSGAGEFGDGTTTEGLLPVEVLGL
jgi:hypothetical protein